MALIQFSSLLLLFALKLIRKMMVASYMYLDILLNIKAIAVTVTAFLV